MAPKGASGGDSAASREQEFLAHWRALPRDGLLPTLTAFLDHPDPRFAPWVSLFDVVSERTVTVRLFGTRMADTFGDITTLNFLDFISEDMRGAVGRAHRLICDLPCGWVTHARAITTNGRAVIPETITLPLLHKGAACCVVKFTNILRELEYSASGGGIEAVRLDHWIDLGAGVPGADALS